MAAQALPSAPSPCPTSAPTPYLALNIPQGLAVAATAEAESKQQGQDGTARAQTIVDLFEQRAAAQAFGGQVAVGFSAPRSQGKGGWEWEVEHLVYADLPIRAKALAATLSHDLSAASAKLPPANPGLPGLTPAPVVAILSPSGIDFFLHALAAWYLGMALLPIAPGTTPEGAANLISKTGACAVFVHNDCTAWAQETLQSVEDNARPAIVPMQRREAHVSQAQSSSSSSLPVPALHAAGPASTLIIFHSSGSTGLPKPIYHPHRFWTFSLVGAEGTRDAAYTTTPLYHGGMSDFLRSLQAGSTIFFHPLKVQQGQGASFNTLSVESLVAGHRACSQLHASIAYFLSVPFILEVLSNDAAGVRFLASMRLVSTGGAPLPAQVGDRLVREGGVPLVSRLGSSECGFLLSSARDFATDKEWSWLRVPDEATARLLRFRPENEGEGDDTGDDADAQPGLYELIVSSSWPTKLLSKPPAQQGAHPVDPHDFATEDLYERHPAHAHWYRYAARLDDTLVLVNGKKFAAGLIEQKLKQSPRVSKALVFGAGKAMVGAIIVPEHTAQGDGFLEALGPHLREVNAALPSHAQLATELILLAREGDDDAEDRTEVRADASAMPAISLPRSSKGTHQRARAYAQLAPLIERVYSDFEEGRTGAGCSGTAEGKIRLQGRELREFLAAMVGGVLRGEGGPPLTWEEDFFRAGMDSIKSVRIRAGVLRRVDLGDDAAKGQRDPTLAQSVAYDHPSVEDLAAHIESLQGCGDGGGAHAAHKAEATHRQMQAMVETYASSLPAYVPRSEGAGPHVVVLTGATGALGAHVLAQVLASSSSSSSSSSDDDVQVLCLVRARDDAQAEERVRASLASRKLSGSGTVHAPVREEHWAGGRVRCFAADLAAASGAGSASGAGIGPLGTALPRGTPTSTSTATFAALAHSAARLSVLHAAWSVNFALSLKSFEVDNIAGLRNLLAFAREEGASQFVFCSSLAAVLSGPSAGPSDSETPMEGGKEGHQGDSNARVHLIEERASTDPRTAGDVGYSQSKWVAEGLCARAALDAHSATDPTATPAMHTTMAPATPAMQTTVAAPATPAMHTTVARIGQLCSDSAHGVWNHTEAWPLLVRAGLALRAMPRIEQEVDWLPVDVAARSLVEVLGRGRGLRSGQAEGQRAAEFMHVSLPTDVRSPATPRTPTWCADFLPWLSEAAAAELGLVDGAAFESVELGEWFRRFDAQAGGATQGQADAAARALRAGIWRGLAPAGGGPQTRTVISTANARAACPTLAQAEGAAECDAGAEAGAGKGGEWLGMDAELLRRSVRAWRESGFLRACGA